MEGYGAAVTSVDVSKSGRYVFVAYDDEPYCAVWPTLTATHDTHGVSRIAHSARVSELQVCPNGYSIATACSDRKLRVWK